VSTTRCVPDGASPMITMRLLPPELHFIAHSDAVAFHNFAHRRARCSFVARDTPDKVQSPVTVLTVEPSASVNACVALERLSPLSRSARSNPAGTFVNSATRLALRSLPEVVAA